MISASLIEADSHRLSKVAVMRLGAPYTAQCPPFVDFPVALREIIEGHSAILDGGLESEAIFCILINTCLILVSS